MGNVTRDWEAWRSRSLAAEDIAQLILYQGGVSATVDGQVTELVLNVVIGVRPDGARPGACEFPSSIQRQLLVPAALSCRRKPRLEANAILLRELAMEVWRLIQSARLISNSA